MLRRFPALVLAMLVLSGCISQDALDLVPARIEPAPADAVAARHQIFIASTRGEAESASQVFDRQRSPKLGFAQAEISVPKAHRIGQIERRRGAVADPAKDFTATKVAVFKGETPFEQTLRADLKRSQGRALIFIHGYNTGFDAAVYRFTQIVHDSGFAGTPLLFSWASGGKTVDYVYDSNSASAARDGLEESLRLLARAGATRIDVIAHSMGSWVTMEALRQLAIAGDRDLGGRLGDVMLASPDIDVDVFKGQMRRYGKPDRPFVVMLSDDDRALRLSGLIAGNRPRLGDYRDAKDLAELGIVVVDLSGIAASDRLGHTKFAENPLLIKLIGEQLAIDAGTEDERDLTDRVDSLAKGLGQSVVSAAEIIITTPVDVLRIAVGQ